MGGDVEAALQSVLGVLLEVLPKKKVETGSATGSAKGSEPG